REEGRDGLRTEALDLVLELVGDAAAVGLLGLRGILVAIGEARRDVRRVEQPRLIAAPPRRMAADRERADGVAVIGLAPRDQPRALLLADLEEILARELERRLDRLGAALYEEHLVEVAGRVG